VIGAVTDCAREDSGNYTCEVRGKRSSILAAVTHHLYIRGITEPSAARTAQTIRCLPSSEWEQQ